MDDKDEKARKEREAKEREENFKKEALAAEKARETGTSESPLH